MLPKIKTLFIVHGVERKRSIDIKYLMFYIPKRKKLPRGSKEKT
jgi:hypothetical protein